MEYRPDHQMTHALIEEPQARIILFGVVYAVVGIGYGELANLASSDQVRSIWRLGAWVACAAVYAGHIWYEHFRLYSRVRSTSLHAGAAVALGGLLLAVAALAHALTVPTHAPYRLYLIALVVWPIITGVPAFLVALVLTAGLMRLSTKRLPEYRRGD
jgi:divalent metal cation (Fe/Co/Zn/Cd) transporter